MNLALLVCFALATCALAAPAPISGKVVAVHDGDTITLLTGDKTEEKIRLEGIDAPELKQAFGMKAKAALSSLVFGKQVLVHSKGHDRYKRTLGRVEADGKDINLRMVQDGMAWLLGAIDPSANALDKLPQASRNGTYLRLTFRCLKSTKRGNAQVKVQSSSDLGASDPWTSHEAAVPEADGTVNGVVFDTTADGDFINVIADIPAAGTNLFGRLQATP